jgi:hypothetical protein
MPRYVLHYDFDDASEWIDCGNCGWAGFASEASIELFEALCDLECPKCGARLIVITYPTHEDTRAAAAAGNEEAQRDLAGIEQVEARWAKADAIALKRPSQLPRLRGPVHVIWDFEDRDGEHFTILRAGDQVLWGELAYWEGIDRFKQIARLLRKRYGRRLKSITPTEASELYLYGDKLSAPDTVDWINAELASRPWWRRRRVDT